MIIIKARNMSKSIKIQPNNAEITIVNIFLIYLPLLQLFKKTFFLQNLILCTWYYNKAFSQCILF